MPGLRAITSMSLLVFAVACTKPPNDARITSDIQARLAADSGLQAKQLTVQSEKGTVTLSGNVDNDAQRDAAAKYASSEPGVKTVVNNLEVGAPEAPAAQAAAEPAPPAAPLPTDSKPSASRRRSHRSEARNDASLNPPQTAFAPSPAPPPPAEAAAPAPPPPPPAPAPVTVPSGTVLSVRLVDTIDSATAQTGDTFHATLDAPLTVDGDVVVPSHYDLQGHVVNAQASGKFAGRALLVLQLDRLKVGDKSYNIQTDQFSQQTGSRGKNTAEKVGAGAVAGAILGGIFGGGKGAAIGSVAGAGAGGGVQAAGKKPDIKLSSEKVLTFTLQAPVTLVPTTKSAREGQKLPTPDAQ
ncbi:MAG: BON domain-containing protein [Acidobacteria bacterium]|nr:BON domain-containing protein [Acidobacteriota bacterium]